MKELNTKQTQYISGAAQFLQITEKYDIEGMPDSFIEQYVLANRANIVGKNTEKFTDEMVISCVQQNLNGNRFKITNMPVEAVLINK